jgi:solute:Na+ symporter, SSS family
MSHFFRPIDGSIVGDYLLATMIAGVSLRTYVSPGAHFLAAGRETNFYQGIAWLAATEFGR